jgi:hypothetical protein
MKLKFYLVNLLLLIGSISVTVLFSEFILKAFGIGSSVSDNVMNVNENGVVLKSENPKLVYTFKPNFPNETSSQGFREDRVYQRVKDPGVSRIIALGDSVAYGVAVSVRKNFLSLLEERANLARKQRLKSSIWRSAATVPCKKLNFSKKPVWFIILMRYGFFMF